MRIFLTLMMAAAVAGPALAQDAAPAKPNASCLYFSPNPDDDNGPPLTFVAELRTEEESWVTQSNGVGHIDFTLDRKTLELKWKGSFKDLTTPPKSFGIHGPQTPGGEAGKLLDLEPEGQVKSPFEGSTKLTPGLLVYLVQDRMYVQLTTAKYPQGELRSTIRKIRPKC